MLSLPRTEQERFRASLTESEKAKLLYDWLFWARDKQLPPPGNWSIWLILSGRGFGKTRTGAQWIRSRAESGKYGRFALIGETAADVRDVMVEGDSGILACSPPWFKPKYEPSKRRLTWPNGATAICFSGDDPEQLRGPQFDSGWVDELAKFRYARETWDNFEMGLRLGDNPQSVVTTTPRPIPLIKELVADPDTVVVSGHTDENRANLSDRYVNRVIRKYEGTRLGRQELGGEILGDTPGALWTRAMIERGRVAKRDVPPLVRIAVAVDPQAADPKDAEDPDNSTAETGIIVGGITGGPRPEAYILADCSVKESPNNWGEAAVAAYDEYQADRIIAETNQGGAMVEFVIRTVADNKRRGKSIPYKGVHASRGKFTRAEPVAGLYEQDRIHHVGAFPDLEDQLCEWVPGRKSPDRLDALVWLLTEMMLDEEEVEEPKTVPTNPLMMLTSSRRGK